MPLPRINVDQKIKDILQHVEPLPSEEGCPFKHYQRSADDLWNLRDYMDRKVKDSKHYQRVAKRHMTSLDRMLLVNLIETFERFLKEMAAICVNHLNGCVLDNRFDTFSAKGSVVAAHFGAGTLGEALCESDTWLNCDLINERFRKLLSDPFVPGTFYVFPNRGQSPSEERSRYPIISLIWQLRHTIVHNVGVVTKSDAVKFKLLIRGPVKAQQVLVPTRDDVRYVKQFLDETTGSVNARVGKRLGELLTELCDGDPTLFDAQDKANELSQQFDMRLLVGGSQGAP